MEQLCLPGGFTDEIFEQLSNFALKHMVNKIDVEQNYGNGMFAQMWRPILLKTYKALPDQNSPARASTQTGVPAFGIRQPVPQAQKAVSRQARSQDMPSFRLRRRAAETTPCGPPRRPSERNPSREGRAKMAESEG